MKKTLIITSYIEDPEKLPKETFSEIDYVICADGGWVWAEKFGLEYDIVLGDFDSSEKPDCPEKIMEFNRIKNFTDLEAAIELSKKMNKRNDQIYILGGIGGRLDHTLGNVAILSKYPGITIFDGKNRMKFLTPGTYTINKDGYKFVGFISYSPVTTGLTLKGFHYPLDNYSLANNSCLCVSNQITKETAEVSFKEGLLICTQSHEE